MKLSPAQPQTVFAVVNRLHALLCIGATREAALRSAKNDCPNEHESELIVWEMEVVR